MWWWVSSAMAGTPVIFDGVDGGAIVQAVASRSGLPAEQLTPMPLDELLHAAPEALGEGVLRRCTRAGSQGDLVRTELARAEAAAAEEDRISAFDHLDLAVAQLGCLTELPDRKVSARVFLLRGALLAAETPEDAAGEFRTALAFSPELQWDPSFPEGGMALLVAARGNVGTATVSVVPDTSTSGPWINGTVVSDAGVRVGHGLHLIQYAGASGVASAWLVVGGDATLVLPGAFRRPVVERMADPTDRSDVESLLAAAIPDLEAAYIAWAGGLWLVTKDANGVSTFEIAPADLTAPSADEPGGKGKKGKKGKK